MQACFKIKKILNGVKVSIIKESKLLFEQTQLNYNKKYIIIESKMRSKYNELLWY